LNGWAKRGEEKTERGRQTKQRTGKFVVVNAMRGEGRPEGGGKRAKQREKN